MFEAQKMEFESNRLNPVNCSGNKSFSMDKNQNGTLEQYIGPTTVLPGR